MNTGVNFDAQRVSKNECLLSVRNFKGQNRSGHSVMHEKKVSEKYLALNQLDSTYTLVDRVTTSQGPKQDFKPLIGIIKNFLTSLSILIKCKLAKGSVKNHVDKRKWVGGWSNVHITK